jgi:hypothetical protein
VPEVLEALPRRTDLACEFGKPVWAEKNHGDDRDNEKFGGIEIEHRTYFTNSAWSGKGVARNNS